MQLIVFSLMIVMTISTRYDRNFVVVKCCHIILYIFARTRFLLRISYLFDVIEHILLYQVEVLSHPFDKFTVSVTLIDCSYISSVGVDAMTLPKASLIFSVT